MGDIDKLKEFVLRGQRAQKAVDQILAPYCKCGHHESMHYDKDGRCAGDKGHCGCVLWNPKGDLPRSW